MDPSALGRYLRESRETKEITLEDAVRALRIRRDILEAFEQGEFTVMDSAVRVRGMLRNYAQYLGLDEERVLQYYESAHSKTRRRRFGQRETHVEPIAPRKITDTPPSLPAVTITQESSTSRLADILRNLAMILVALAAIAVIIFVMLDRLGLMDDDPDLAIATTPITGILSETPTNTPTITPRATVITDTPAPSLGVTGVQIDLEITQRSWVSITVDDREALMGFLEPGHAQRYVANDSILLRAANAAALAVIYNGTEQESFGARGQEVEITFTNTSIDVMQDPIALPTAIPTGEPESNVPSEANTIAGDASAQAESQSTPIPTSSIPTPTPLFSVNTFTDDDTATVADDPTQAPDVATTMTSLPLNAETTAPTATVNSNSPTPAPTETANVALPLRITPSNPTPTKTG